MIIKSSTALRNNYGEVSELAKTSGEPIYITVNGSGDGVYMALNAFERLEETILMRTRVLTAENARPNGARTYSPAEIEVRISKKYGA